MKNLFSRPTFCVAAVVLLGLVASGCQNRSYAVRDHHGASEPPVRVTILPPERSTSQGGAYESGTITDNSQQLRTATNNTATVVPGLPDQHDADTAVGGAEIEQGLAASSSAAGSTITDIASIAAGDEALVGRSVNFSDLKVESVLDQRLVVLSSDQSQEARAYAIVSQPVQDIAEGDKVSLTGKLQKTTGGTATLNLGPEASHVLSAQPFYIQVDRLQKAD